MHGALRCGFIQLLGDEPELLAGRFGVSFAKGCFKVLNLRFDLALTRPIYRSAFDVLSCSFFRL